MRKIYSQIRNINFPFLDILLPFSGFILLVSLISVIIFSGEKHRKISSLIENDIINYNLKRLGFNNNFSKNIYLISLDPKDLPRKNKNQESIYLVYKEIIFYLLEKKPQLIAVNWGNIEKNTRLVSEIVRQNKKRSPETKIIFAVKPEHIPNAPNIFNSKNISFLESDPCEKKYQTFCTYNLSWKSWMIQYISETNQNDQKIQNFHSHNTPRLHSSYLIYLSFPSIKNFLSKEKLINATMLDMGKYFFIGPSNKLLAQLEKPYSFENPVFLPQKGEDIKTESHVFWASLYSYFNHENIIKTAELQKTLFFNILFVLLLIFCLCLFRTELNLIIFSIFYLIIFFSNIMLIKLFKTYTPVFIALYACLICSMVLIYSKALVIFYETWKKKIHKQNTDDILDSKNNFISLVTHNLNTPIAKIMGVLQIIHEKRNIEQKKIKEIIKISTELKLNIQFKLTSIHLEKKNTLHPPQIFINIKDTLNNNIIPLIKSLELNVTYTINNPSRYYKFFSLDKIFLSIILALISIFIHRKKSPNIHLKLRQEEKENFFYDYFIVSGDKNKIEETTFSYLAADKACSRGAIKNFTATEQTAIDMLRRVLETYNGQFNCKLKKKEAHLIVVLHHKK
ncbi:MAG: hypothetical protein CMP11_06495 [Zetaproteobacteria bacterium]|nr:hypothetical protein [Pseudobdellovibrionaceae bacterium]